MSSLIIPENKTYVYNPTSDWYSCEVRGDKKSQRIEVIPPRSIRSFPSTVGKNAKLQRISKLMPDQIQRYVPSQSGDSNLILEPIDVKISGYFDGNIELPNSQNVSIRVYLKIDRTVAYGYYLFTDNLYHLIKANIQPKTHNITLCKYNDEEGIEILSGRFDKIDSTYQIDVSSSNSRIVLNTSQDQGEKLWADPIFTGKYLAFYARGNSQRELDVRLEVLSNGFITGTCTENDNTNDVYGVRIDGTQRVVIIRQGFSLDSPFYFIGEYSNDGSILISGTWKSGSDHGEFFLSKCD
ncbi:hypothetical protein GPJ56_003739 [Histomonas meleagridis]|uniref:uncharacterized protein n=1 Tax=Histomonas meleagridis TaxID=135588 RepID=UPI0035594004|nr:hypothetical protein GPJ56_003739 [Histomonas meleagridis]KAH0805197.1 hypothetical protein GO595_002142 [Histomonas meleagridis]